MGEAKRRQATGTPSSWCRACTYCCTLPDIAALEKPMYRPCGHIRGGCGIFGRPERPGACLAYECAYLTARRTQAPDRNRIPHPLDAGAYFHRDPVEKVFVLFIDPDRPQRWKASPVVDYLRPHLAAGFALLVIDRGRRMVIPTPALFEEILRKDYVDFADREGRPLDIPSYRTERGGGAFRTRSDAASPAILPSATAVSRPLPDR